MSWHDNPDVEVYLPRANRGPLAAHQVQIIMWMPPPPGCPARGVIELLVRTLVSLCFIFVWRNRSALDGIDARVHYVQKL